MATKKKTEEEPTAAAEAAAPEPAPKPAKPEPPAAKFVVYQKPSGSYTIAGVHFPPFAAVRTAAALADRIDGSVDPSVLRVYADEEKAKAAAKALKSKLTPSTGDAA